MIHIISNTIRLSDYEMGKEFRKAVAEIEETDESCSTDVDISHLVSYYR